MCTCSNADLAELLARAAADASGMREKALKRASRALSSDPEEAAEIVASGRSLQELHSVGPFIAQQLQSWIDHPPPDCHQRDPLRHDFLTFAEARAILERAPQWRQQVRAIQRCASAIAEATNGRRRGALRKAWRTPEEITPG